jgi:hypothetical protein
MTASRPDRLRREQLEDDLHGLGSDQPFGFPSIEAALRFLADGSLPPATEERSPLLDADRLDDGRDRMRRHRSLCSLLAARGAVLERWALRPRSDLARAREPFSHAGLRRVARSVHERSGDVGWAPEGARFDPELATRKAPATTRIARGRGHRR